MTKFDSVASKFLITDTGAVERDLSVYLTDIEGLPGPRDMLDTTTLGALGHTHIPSITNGQFSLRGIYDDTAVSGPAVVLQGLRKHTAAVTFKYGPKGSTAGFPRRTGTCWVEDYTEETHVGRWVGFNCRILLEGDITLDTF